MDGGGGMGGADIEGGALGGVEAGGRGGGAYIIWL